MALDEAYSLYFYLGIFAASLVSSWHCVVMCGPLMLSSCQSKTNSYYQIGRLVSYLILGAVAGWMGEKLFQSDLVRNFKVLLAVFIFLGLTVVLFKKYLIHTNMVVYFYKLISRYSPPTRSFGVGAMSGLLPCGLLYSFVFLAAAGATWQHSIAVMFLFWLGTVPALSALVFAQVRSSELFKKYFRTPQFARIQTVMSGAVVVLSIFMIFKKFEHLPAEAQHSANIGQLIMHSVSDTPNIDPSKWMCH